jgi:hypothetical protein
MLPQLSTAAGVEEDVHDTRRYGILNAQFASPS